MVGLDDIQVVSSETIENYFGCSPHACRLEVPERQGGVSTQPCTLSEPVGNQFTG
jgi:hypothetical protein